MSADLIGRHVIARGEQATIIQYDPLGSGMTDALLKFDSGRECWYASHELRYLDGSKLPDRVALKRQADAHAVEQLKAIRAAHIRDWNRPWPGMEFGKAHFGQMVDGALAALSPPQDSVL